MVHQYKNNGYNMVLDVASGSVHVDVYKRQQKSRGIEEETWVMIRKYKIYIIMGITVLLLFMVLPVDTKGDWEIPWNITLEEMCIRDRNISENIWKNGRFLIRFLIHQESLQLLAMARRKRSH